MIKFTRIIKDDAGKWNSFSTIDSSLFLDALNKETKSGYISLFRKVYDSLSSPERYVHRNKIPEICFQAEYGRRRNGVVFLKAYNGLVALQVEQLNNDIEMEHVKHQAALNPQTVMAFTGCDAHSVVVLVKVSLPQGDLPVGMEDAQLFHAVAYQLAVRAYSPILPYPITIVQPTLDRSIPMSLDEKPYVNPAPVPFILEQPTVMPDDDLQEVRKKNHLLRMEGVDGFVRFHKMFQAAMRKALDEMDGVVGPDRELVYLTAAARQCARAGIPEEEATRKLLIHEYGLEEADVRAAVRLEYEKTKPQRSRSIPRRQQVAFKLEEFIRRRYKVRFNEVKQVTEYCVNESIQVPMRELSRRDINTISHEAALEGVNATTKEVAELLESDFVKRYNPIEEWLFGLPQWDGHDHIGDLLQRVPTDNPYWMELGRRWFLSMVAHWYKFEWEYANSTAPILVGAQGYRKSTFCKLILPPEFRSYYADSIDFRDDNEAERFLSRFLLINIDEYDKLSERQVALVKHIFQKTEVAMRQMHSENIAKRRRYASFIGTTNEAAILRDPTGSRRYLCLNVTAPIDVTPNVNYQQLYAQAMALIPGKERCYINEEDEALIREQNRGFQMQMPLEQIFLDFYQVPVDLDDGEWVRPTEIMAQLKQHPVFVSGMNNFKTLNTVLTQLNAHKRRIKTGMVYLLKKR